MELLKINDLNHAFGGLQAISNFNVKVDKDCIHGVIGPNGAGKTTLFNLITGLYSPQQGEILFQEMNLAGKKPFDISRLGIARTFQNLRLFGELTVIENIQVGQLQRGAKSRLGFWGRLFNQSIDKKAAALLELFGLTDRAQEKSGNLPYGMQRKLEIARALATEPKLLLLDEPAAGMNPQEVLTLVELIREAKRVFNITIVLIEHQMRLVEELCQDVTVMNFGGIIAQGKTAHVQNDPVVIKAYLGEGEIA